MSDNVYADLVAAQAAEIERLTRERDETLDLMRKHYDDHQRATRLLDEWIVRAHTAEAERDALQSAINCRWTDRADDLSAEINRTHPLKVKDFDRWNRAQVLVNNRHSKGALISLVAYLLRAEANAARLREALIGIVDAWDWWDKYQYDRCQSVVADAVADARAALGGQP